MKILLYTFVYTKIFFNVKSVRIYKLYTSKSLCIVKADVCVEIFVREKKSPFRDHPILGRKSIFFAYYDLVFAHRRRDESEGSPMHTYTNIKNTQKYRYARLNFPELCPYSRQSRPGNKNIRDGRGGATVNIEHGV